MPGGSGYLASFRAYIVSFLSGEPQQYIGHNPVARIGITLLFFLLAVQLATGLVIAGTDLFWPPFGHWFAQWIAAPGVDPTAIQPGNTDLIDKATYQAMRAFRRPFVTVHEIAFYALIVLIVLHIIAVVITEFMRVATSRLRCLPVTKFLRVDRLMRLRKDDKRESPREEDPP